MIRGAIIICIFYCTMEIKAYCSPPQEDTIVNLNNKFTMVINGYNNLESKYNEYKKNKKITGTFAPDIYNSVLAHLHVPLSLTSQNFANCQNLVKREIVQSLRTNVVWQNFLRLEKKMSLLVKRRNELVEKAINDYKELKVLFQKLESSACQDAQVFVQDAYTIKLQLYAFERERIKPYEEIIQSSIAERISVMKELEGLTLHIHSLINTLKSRRDLQGCIKS